MLPRKDDVSQLIDAFSELGSIYAENYPSGNSHITNMRLIQVCGRESETAILDSARLL